MPTIIKTGRALTLTIDGDTWNPQVSQVTLTYTNTTETYQTLDGPVSIATGTEGSLAVSGFQDYAQAGTGLCDALWTAADAGTAIGCVLDDGEQEFTFDVVPQYPPVGGEANAALTFDITFVLDGGVSKQAVAS